MKKRLTAVLMALFMVLSVMPKSQLGVRAEGETTGTRYVEVTSLSAGSKYILAVEKDESSVYAIKKSDSNTSSAVLTVIPASGDNNAYIETDDTGFAWEYTSSKYFTNDSVYLYPSSSNGIMTYNSGRAIDYSAGVLSFSTSSSGTYYFTCDDGAFNTSSVAANAASFRIFEEVPGSGEENPDEPAGQTVDITPDATNVPEREISIEVGETFVINVTNASTRSSYTFTATSSEEDIVEYTGGASVEVAASGTGQITVKGLADGTVDITVQNNNSSSNRKGIIHVTVGDGGSTPVDPPAGQTVAITPDATNVPEEEISIEVGETFVINVTNASTRSSYTFTATSSEEDIVEYTGGASVEVAASGTGQITVKGLADGTVDITVQNNGQYSNRKGIIHVTVGDGGSTPVDPPAGQTVAITPDATNVPEEEISIEVGETFVINVTNASTRSSYTFTATSSEEDIVEYTGGASVEVAASGTGQITVKGLADGTVDITVQNNGQYSNRKGIIHVTVGDGGSTPVDPPAGQTVAITPDATNVPEEEISIEVGETFVINVTNASTRSSYTFTATSSEEDIVEYTGGASVEVAASGTGQITVKGLADGTVDITVQNNNSSSNRKGIIHVTVGDGGSTPVDPPAGQTVAITPDADNVPEEEISIEVGETFVINVTNASTRSSYTFTATSSEEDIVEYTGGASVEVAAGKTGQITVKGLTDGTVDITVQNNGSYSNRQGIIHVTVGDGGSTPVDPPATETVYKLTTEMPAEGEKMIIVNGNSGSVYVLGNESTGSGATTGIRGISATVDNDGKIKLSGADAAKAEFTIERKTSPNGAVSAWLKHGENNYLYANSSNGLRINQDQTTNSGSTNNTGKFWHYTSENDKNLLWYFKDTSEQDGFTDDSSIFRYYLQISNGIYTVGHVSSNEKLSETDTPAIYLFIVDDGSSQEEVAVTGVTVVPTSAALIVDETVTLSATVEPENAANKNVTWTSSNGAVATVDQTGKVTAVGAGIATITVTTEDGSKTAECEVTVTVPDTSVTVSGTVVSFCTGKDHADEDGVITLTLTKEGETQPAYTTTATTTGTTPVTELSVQYSFDEVNAGTYTLKVEKAYHAARTYQVVITAGTDVELNAKIHLIGDVTGDGKISTVDAARTNSHAKSVTFLDEYQIVCADVDNNGRITVDDATTINAHVRGVTPLW